MGSFCENWKLKLLPNHINISSIMAEDLWYEFPDFASDVEIVLPISIYKLYYKSPTSLSKVVVPILRFLEWEPGPLEEKPDCNEFDEIFFNSWNNHLKPQDFDKNNFEAMRIRLEVGHVFSSIFSKVVSLAKSLSP